MSIFGLRQFLKVKYLVFELKDNFWIWTRDTFRFLQLTKLYSDVGLHFLADKINVVLNFIQFFKRLIAL